MSKAVIFPNIWCIAGLLNKKKLQIGIMRNPNCKEQQKKVWTNSHLQNLHICPNNKILLILIIKKLLFLKNKELKLLTEKNLSL